MILKPTFVVINGTQRGPFDEAALLAACDNSDINAQTLGWQDGMSSWVPMSVIAPEMFSRKPPPIPRNLPSLPTPVESYREPDRATTYAAPLTPSNAATTISRSDVSLTIASGGTRFIAGLIDFVVMSIIGGVGTVVIPVVGGLILTTLYLVIMMANSSTQGTLGMMAMGIKIVDDKGGAITTGTSVVRMVVSYISAVILMLGFIMMFFTGRRQTLHDKVAGTIVVKR